MDHEVLRLLKLIFYVEIPRSKPSQPICYDKVIDSLTYGSDEDEE